MQYNIKYQTLFKYRSVWMAIAILMVTFFHSSININPIIKTIRHIGYGGVDIFIFASGLGCYYSLNKNNDIIAFLQRRIKRILPMIFVIMPFHFAYYSMFDIVTFQKILGSITFCGDFAGLKNCAGGWYLNAIFLFYILAPWFATFTKYTNKNLKNILLFILLLLISFVFINNHEFIRIFARLPIFFLGVWLANYSLNKKEYITNKEILFSILAMLIGFISLALIDKIFPLDIKWNYGLLWYPFILIVPGFCLIISLLSELLFNTKYKKFVKILDVLGKYTLPIYLAHPLIYRVTPLFLHKINFDLPHSYICLLEFILIIIFTIILILLEKIFIKIVGKLSYKF